MKKIVVLFWVVILTGSMLASCESSSKNENTIIGKWTYGSHGNTNTMEFLDNGKFNATIYQPVYSDDGNSSYNVENPFPTSSISYVAHNFTGTYVINGDKITVTDNDAKIEQISTFAVNNSTLTLTTGGMESSGIKTDQTIIVYKRQNKQ